MAYFDYAASSIKRKEMIQTIVNNMELYEGNSSSIHSFGRNASKHLEKARAEVALEINAKVENFIFTSGASEANNMVIQNFDLEDIHVITSSIEHKSVLDSIKKLKAEKDIISCDKSGRINIDEIISKIKPNTKLIALMMVNNETGIIQDVYRLGELLRDKEIWFHVDAVQAFGHLDIDVEKMNCDSLSISGHKIGAMHGIGGLYLKNRIKPMIIGGSHEFQLRAGTTNVMASVSFANAISYIKDEKNKIIEIKKYFLERLGEVDHEINGDVSNSVDHIVNVFFPYIKSDLLMTYLDVNGVCVSTGSACNAGALIPSYVLENMYDLNRASNSIRFSFGFTNTKEDVNKVIDLLKKINEKKKLESV